MKTLSLPYEDYLALEGELRALKAHKEQQDKLTRAHLLNMTPEQLQELRSDVTHPWWTEADRQLQERQANAERSQKKGFFK